MDAWIVDGMFGGEKEGMALWVRLVDCDRIGGWCQTYAKDGLRLERGEGDVK